MKRLKDSISFKESQVNKLRECHSHPLVVRVNNSPREILAQIKHDHEANFLLRKKNASFSWKRAARAHKAKTIAQKLKDGANAAMAQMKTPSKKKKGPRPRNSTNRVNDSGANTVRCYHEGRIRATFITASKI